MLVNQKDVKKEKHVEFVSYDGKYPNLCDGTLVLKIDGKRFTFSSQSTGTYRYSQFWVSGGCCRGKSIEHDEWKIDVSELPEDLQKYATEIDQVFNENVTHGCCGGCR